MNTKSAIAPKTIRLVFGLIILLALLSPMPGSMRVAKASGPYVVNMGYDGPDSDLGDGICYDGVGGCTLRAAIQQASADGAATTITFDSSLAGTTIPLSGSYGMIVWAGSNITVDGGSQNITISGEFMNAGQNMFQIQGNDNTLTNLTLKNSRWDGIQVGDFAGVGYGNRNTISNLKMTGHLAAAIYVYGGANSGGQDNVIATSVIGASSNLVTSCISGEGNGYDGVRIETYAHRTIVNGNRIVCNGNFGVNVYGPSGSSENVQITYNDIGGYGINDMGNAWDGINVAATNNTLIHGNVIVGNGYDGIWVNNSQNTTMTFNAIGVNSGGVSAVPNDLCGIGLTDAAHDNTIGGSGVGDKNYISGNGDSGVCIEGGSHDNLVEGNLIGLNGAGTTAIPNGQTGVAVRASDNNYIGTSMGGVTQYISGNTLAGIYVENSSGTFIGQTNRVGVASDNVTPIGNGQEGILLNGAVNTSVFPWIIAHNGGAGVAVVGDAALGNKITIVDDVHGNGGLPVDLGNDGHTANGAHTPPGPNNWLAYPVITGGAGSNVTGTACNDCLIIIYQASGNPTAAGGGGIYLMEVTANGSGDWSAVLPGGVTASQVTVAACEAPCSTIGNTSEMSPMYNSGGGGYKIYLPIVKR